MPEDEKEEEQYQGDEDDEQIVKAGRVADVEEDEGSPTDPVEVEGLQVEKMPLYESQTAKQKEKPKKHTMHAFECDSEQFSRCKMVFHFSDKRNHDQPIPLTFDSAATLLKDGEAGPRRRLISRIKPRFVVDGLRFCRIIGSFRRGWCTVSRFRIIVWRIIASLWICSRIGGWRRRRWGLFGQGSGIGEVGRVRWGLDRLKLGFPEFTNSIFRIDRRLVFTQPASPIRPSGTNGTPSTNTTSNSTPK